MELLESSGMSVEQVSIAYQEDSQFLFDCLGSGEMDFNDAQQLFNMQSSLSKPRAADDIHASHVREDWTTDCEPHKDSQAVTLDGRRDLLKIGQYILNGDIHNHPSNPLECAGTVIKDLPAKTLGEKPYHMEGLSSAMSSVAEALAQCSLLTKVERVDKDDLMVKFASLFKQRIEDALEPLRAPVAFVFQRRWELERKCRQDILAREEKMLVLRRKMIQLKRRRGGRVRRSTRRAIISSARTSRRPTEVLGRGEGAVNSQLTMGS